MPAAELEGPVVVLPLRVGESIEVGISDDDALFVMDKFGVRLPDATRVPWEEVHRFQVTLCRFGKAPRLKATLYALATIGTNLSVEASGWTIDHLAMRLVSGRRVNYDLPKHDKTSKKHRETVYRFFDELNDPTQRAAVLDNPRAALHRIAAKSRFVLGEG